MRTFNILSSLRQAAKKSGSTSFVNHVIFIINIFNVIIPLSIGYGVHLYYHGVIDAIITPEYMLQTLFFSVMNIWVYQFFGMNEPSSVIHPLRVWWITPLCNLLTFSLLIVIAFAMKTSDHTSRVWAFAFLGLNSLATIGMRIGIGLWVRAPAQLYRLRRHIAIVGTGPESWYFLSHIQQTDSQFTQIVGVYTEKEQTDGETIHGIPVCGTIDDLLQEARRQRIDDVIIGLPWSDDGTLHFIIERLRELPVNVHLAAAPVVYRYAMNWSHGFGDIPALTVQTTPLNSWGGTLKVIEDRVIAVLALLVFSPIMLLVALAIKCESRGPVLYRQDRYGFNNQIIRVYKFRSMYQRDESQEKHTPQATQNDSRVTRIGALIRRTSLDELPQLFNVLNGSMSLVGPRPHAVAHNEQYSKLIDGYFSRHRVKPGITGWAQINGLRGETDTLEKMQRRVEYDIYYIENWSLAFDIRILVHTAFVGFISKNAY